MWEHLVLEHLLAHFPNVEICYWRDKSGREIDFVLAHSRDRVDTIECKWTPQSFDSTSSKRSVKSTPMAATFWLLPHQGLR